MSNHLTLILLVAELVLLLVPPLMNWDKTSRSFVLAVRGLWLHKLRAFLSVLGIIIGTSAVISLMAFGKGSMEDALEEIRRQGTTNIIVKSVKPVIVACAPMKKSGNGDRLAPPRRRYSRKILPARKAASHGN